MPKKIRFPLKLADGAQARSLEELKEHFDLASVLEHYSSGKLLTWLQDRYIESEAQAVAALDQASPDFQKSLCAIFGVEYVSEEDLEAIQRRQERLARLRAITDDDEFLQNIDQVAFDQEELADLLDEGITTIYLCGAKFLVPVSQKGVTYVGINMPAVHLSGTLPEDMSRAGITCKGCAVDNWPDKEFAEKPGEDFETMPMDQPLPSTSDDPETDDPIELMMRDIRRAEQQYAAKEPLTTSEDNHWWSSLVASTKAMTDRLGKGG